MTTRRTIRGDDHWLYVGRISHAPATGRPILEVVGDDDEVLVRDGDEFVTFWAGRELDPVTPEWPADEPTEPTAEAVALAETIAHEGPTAVAALERAVRIVRALEDAGLDPDDPLVRLASAVILQVIAHELGDDHG